MGRPENMLANGGSPAGALGAAIRDLRHAAGLSQTELASLSGCVPATVGQVERGRFLPSAALLERWEAELTERGTLLELWERAVLGAHRARATNAGNSE